MVRPAIVSINSPSGPTISNRALNSGCMKYRRIASSDLSMRWRNISGSYPRASLTREAVFIRIIVIECPCASMEGKYFGERNPGVSSIYMICSSIFMAFSAYDLSPEAIEYSAMAIAAKPSENTYLRFRSGVPSAVTSKYICPSVSIQYFSMKSIQLFEASSHS